MLNTISISIIVPFYNSKKYISACLKNLINQKFDFNFEIILINDGSKDGGEKELVNFKNYNIKLFTLKKNLGPSAARNLGIKNAKGKYIFFLDVDDEIAPNTLSELYKYTLNKNYDFIFCDYKRIFKKINMRKNKFNYCSNKIFNNNEIKRGMINQIHYNNLGHQGLFGINGRLIKASLIKDNNIFFEEKLRYLEDETFAWDILSFTKKCKYVRKQFYIYNVNPSTNSAVSQGLNKNYPISNFKLNRLHIEKCLLKKKFSKKQIKIYTQQAFIFYIITALISYSRSIFLGKINKKVGFINRRRMINKIIKDKEVSKAITNYKCGTNENKMIPFAIKTKSLKLIEINCNLRAKELIKL